MSETFLLTPPTGAPAAPGDSDDHDDDTKAAPEAAAGEPAAGGDPGGAPAAAAAAVGVAAPAPKGPPFSELGLRPEVLSALAEMGFEEAMPVQAATLPAARQRRDLMV